MKIEKGQLYYITISETDLVLFDKKLNILSSANFTPYGNTTALQLNDNIIYITTLSKFIEPHEVEYIEKLLSAYN